MWILFKEGMFLFGEGGITRVEANSGYDVSTQQPSTGTILYSGATRIATTDTTVERIKELLEQYYGY